jgi:hypothetical protein
LVESITAVIFFNLRQGVNHQDSCPGRPAGSQGVRNDWHSGRPAGRLVNMVSLEAAKIMTVVPPCRVSGIKLGVREVKCLPAMAQAQGH